MKTMKLIFFAETFWSQTLRSFVLQLY